MPLVVTLHVYSQRADPSWLLSDEQARWLLGQIRSLQELTPLKAGALPGRLGYRGFSISSVPRTLLGEVRLTINDGIIDPGQRGTSLFDPSRSIEKWLLETGRQSISGVVFGLVAEYLLLPAEDLVRDRAFAFRIKPEAVSCAAGAPDAPHYEPATWNAPTVKGTNNCYNYANDKVLCHFSEAGEAHNFSITYSCDAHRGVQPGAEADGLLAEGNFARQLAIGEGWYVALAVFPGEDSHWFRQDREGCWSHKPGNAEASNLDFGGKIITDPKYCDRSWYTEFCSHMITRRGLRIGKRFF